MERQSAAKRRRVTREASSSSSGEVDINDDPTDGEICVETKRTISMQTELTIRTSLHYKWTIRVDRRKLRIVAIQIESSYRQTTS